MKTTPLHEIPELEDKFPILAVEGTVKVAMDVKHSPPDSEKSWSRQFFVLAQGQDEVGCTMWDAEGNEMKKGEHVRIEATQNKKKQWTGMTKGSYEKDGETKHTLEIRANSVKIINLDEATEREPAKFRVPEGHADSPSDPDWPEAPAHAPESSVPTPKVDDGVQETREHLMRVANLYNLCIKATVASICPNIPNEQRTNEQFQSTLASVWIETSSRRSTDGVHWWSYIDKMPSKPLQ